MQKILSRLRKTIKEDEMIISGDKVCVGSSGGKDSMVLLTSLALYKKFSLVDFELEAITISLGFKDESFEELTQYCTSIGVKHTVVKTQIYKIVFDVKEEKNPCSLCTNLKRGALVGAMEERKLNVLALGHHIDDAVETLYMNMLYSGKISTFDRKYIMDDSGVKVIRPLIDASENQIIGVARKYNIPTFKSNCPADKNTKREYVKNMLKAIYKSTPGAKKNIIKAMKNKENLNIW